MSPLEAGARAAYDRRRQDPPGYGRWAAWEDLLPETRANEIAAFKAGLLAIREPTEGAVKTALPHLYPKFCGPAEASAAFTAMIDHLVEGKEDHE